MAFTQLTAHAQDLNAYADSLRSADDIPELAFAIIQPDSILELSVRGFHRIDDRTEQTAAKRDDYFHIGSNTKGITGFVAAYLVEQKKVNWDTKFFDLYPSWKKKSNSTYWQITLQDLLTHKAGIPAYTSGAELKALPEFKGDITQRRKLFCQYILNHCRKEKNNEFSYSNAGYSFAALMMEKVAGKSWEELVMEILNKMGLHPLYGWPNKSSEAQPYGHWVENDTLMALPGNIAYDLALIEPAGDISMSMPDYAKFIQYNLQGLCGKNNILKAETYEFMHYGVNGYAIGWQNIQDGGRQFSEHAGSAGTFYCYAVLDKKKKIAYVIMTNNGSAKASNGLISMLNAMIGKYEQSDRPAEKE